jgi:hypothetical protein
MSSLSHIHRHHILSAFLSIHRQIAELEALIAQGTRSTPFAQYVNDLSTTEVREIQQHFDQIRSTMLVHLEECGIPLEVRPTNLRWVLQSNVMQLQVLIDDMRPKRMTAYGPLDAAGRDTVLKIQADLANHLDRLRSYLRTSAEHDHSQ